MHAAEIVQLAVPGSSKNMDLILKKDGIKEIALQLKIFMTEHLKAITIGCKSGQIEAETVKLHLQLLTIFCKAVTNFLIENKSLQNRIRELQLVGPLFQYLQKIQVPQIIQEQDHPLQIFFSEDLICSVLDLLANTVDTNKQQQDYLFNTSV